LGGIPLFICFTFLNLSRAQDYPWSGGLSRDPARRRTPSDARQGPLFTINGDLNVQDEIDANMVAQKLSFMVTPAGLGA
jgi:hypothetical protein